MENLCLFKFFAHQTHFAPLVLPFVCPRVRITCEPWGYTLFPIVTVFVEFPEVTSSLCAIKEHFRSQDRKTMEWSFVQKRAPFWVVVPGELPLSHHKSSPTYNFNLLQLMLRLVITQCDCWILGPFFPCSLWLLIVLLLFLFEALVLPNNPLTKPLGTVVAACVTHLCF